MTPGDDMKAHVDCDDEIQAAAGRPCISVFLYREAIQSIVRCASSLVLAAAQTQVNV